MFGLQAPELIIILLILLVLFGASRLRGLGGALGGSISEFKKAISDDDPKTVKKIETVESPTKRVETVETTTTSNDHRQV